MAINFVNNNTAYRRMRIPSEGGWNNQAKSCFSCIGLITLPAKALVTLECQSADAVRISFSYRRFSKKSIYLCIKYCNKAVSTHYNRQQIQIIQSRAFPKYEYESRFEKFFSYCRYTDIYKYITHIIFSIFYLHDISLYRKLPSFIYTFKAQMFCMLCNDTCLKVNTY